jgi:hypothetical protein
MMNKNYKSLSAAQKRERKAANVEAAKERARLLQEQDDDPSVSDYVELCIKRAHIRAAMLCSNAPAPECDARGLVDLAEIQDAVFEPDWPSVGDYRPVVPE